MLTAAFTVIVQTASAETTVTAGWAETPPTIDGTLNVGEWDDYFWFTDNIGNSYFGGIPEFTGYVANDNGFLYLAIMVNDQTPLQEANDEIWIEFATNEGNKGFRKGFTLSPDEYGQYFEGAYPTYHQPLPEGVQFGWSTDESNIYYEWKIPLNLLNVNPGNTIKYLMHVREWSQRKINYHPEVTCWAPYNDINQFGDLTLGILPLEATVDIDPDTLNLKSNGQWITAYITLPEGYGVEDIDSETVCLDEIPAVWSEIQDGVFMAKFDRATVRSILTDLPDCDGGIKFQEFTLTVRGQLLNGQPFEGSDTIRAITK